MSIREDKFDQLQKRMESLKIYPADLIEKFILGSGKGGQKLNKTSSCVYIKHIPSGIQIKCQLSRSREYNRNLALNLLCDKIEKKETDLIKEKIYLKEKVRRQNRKRTFQGQEKILEFKRKNSVKKKLRGRPDSDS